MTSPTHHAATDEVAGWFNYEFETDLDCPNKCGPGAHPLYIGKSNDSLRRLLEHAKTQPWFKHVTGWKIHPERYATERESLAAETQRIRARLPLANDKGNEGNRCRIDFGALAPARRPVARRAAAAPVPARRDWSPRQKRAAAWAAAWAALAVALSVGAVVLLPVAALHGVEFGAAGSAALLGAGRYVTLSRRKRKQIRRWVGGVVTAAAVAAVLWMVFAGQVASAVSR